MTLKRFDLGALSSLQSRDGSVSKGGLTRNGFVEKDGESVWSWQRPALGSGDAAPFAGSGLGMFIVGTTLYGMFSAGTATSRAVTFYGTSFSLVAGTHTGGDNEIGYFVSGTTSVGSLAPPSLLKQTVNALEYNGSAGTRTLFSFGTAVLSSTAFSFLVIGTTTLARSTATYGTAAYGTTAAATWRWGGSYVPSGTTTGRIIP